MPLPFYFIPYRFLSSTDSVDNGRAPVRGAILGHGSNGWEEPEGDPLNLFSSRSSFPSNGKLIKTYLVERGDRRPPLRRRRGAPFPDDVGFGGGKNSLFLSCAFSPVPPLHCMRHSSASGRCFPLSASHSAS